MHAYIRTFFTFITSVKRWHVEENIIKSNKNSNEVLQEKNILEHLLDYLKSKEIAENLTSDSDSDDEKSLQDKFSQFYKSSA